MQLQSIERVFRATTATATAATMGRSAGHGPVENAVGENRSFATSAAKAAGGM